MLVIAVLVVAAFFTLKKMYPPEKLKAMTQEWVAQQFHRELRFEDISFTWIGFTLTDVALSEDSTFEQGTFLQAHKLTAHVAVKPLLQKRIEISTIEADDLQVNIVAQKDGSFNFDTLIPNESAEPTADKAASQPEEPTNDNPFVVTAHEIRLQNCDLVYRDEQTGLRTALDDLQILVQDFDVAAPFKTTVSLTTNISGTEQPDLSLPITLDFTTELADLDLAKARATLTQATARYKTVLLHLTGSVTNFEQPHIDLTGKLTGITNQVFTDFAADLPNFTLPAINLAVKAVADLDKKTATLSQAKMTVQDSALSTQGTIGWGGENPTYQLTGSLIAILKQLVQMTDTLDGFSPEGTLTASFRATDKKDFTDVSGTLNLKNVSVLYDLFTLTQLNGQIVLTNLDNIAAPALTGKLNGENFTGSFTYKVLNEVMNIVLNLQLDTLALSQFPSSEQTQAADNTAATQNNAAGASAGSASAANSTPMNIQANVKVGEISVPYFRSNGLTLQANLTNITDSLAHTNGTINFAFQPGKITNLDNFIKDSKTAKILLLPVSIIKKAAEFLKLDLFPTNPETGTSISFTEGAGDYTFTDGVMNIDRTVFNSTVTKITAAGSANFQTDALNMKATATLLTQAAPVSFKITGTMSEPKSKLDVVNTMTSVVGGLLNGTAVKSAANGSASVAKGAATTATDAVKGTVNTAKDVVKGIGGLFKKNK